MGGGESGEAAQGGSGEGEDRVAPEAGKHYDVEMDRAAAVHGKLDACVELSGNGSKMKSKVSIVRTDPFTLSGWEFVPTPRDEYPLYIKQYGSFLDPDGGSCKCTATKDRILKCADYMKKTWDNKMYMAWGQNCRIYVQNLIATCCLDYK